MSLSRHRAVALTLAAALAFVSFSAAFGDEPKARADSTTAKKTANEKAKQPAVTEIKRAPFRIELELKGYLAPKESHEVVFHPRAWSTLKVQTLVPHGARVRRGEVILQLQTDRLKEQLEDLRRQLAQSELSLQIARTEFEIAGRRRKLDRHSVERNAEAAQNELEYFLEVGRPLEERSARFSLQSAQYRLEYAQEELQQLRKMYEADELTEESEEIVLKRAERDVESAKFYLEMARINTERRLSFELPRRAEAVEEAARQARLALESQQRTAALSDRLNELQMKSKILAHEKLTKQLRDYEHDLEAMSVRAPFDGIIYYGSLSRGRVSDAQSAASRLRPGSSLTPGSVVLTIVAPRPLEVDVEVPEAEFYRVKPGQTCQVRAAAFPHRTVEGHLDSVVTVPLKPGTFAARVVVDSVPDDLPLMPGMAARAKLRVYDVAAAITVPATAVKEIDGQTYVWVDRGKEPPEQRAVRTGQRWKEKVEILSGLEVGETVRTRAP